MSGNDSSSYTLSSASHDVVSCIWYGTSGVYNQKTITITINSVSVFICTASSEGSFFMPGWKKGDSVVVELTAPTSAGVAGKLRMTELLHF